MTFHKLYRPLIVSGPSGVGKSSLLKSLLADYPHKFELMVSHTTRKPRSGEKHGVDYYYTSPEDFNRMVQEKKFIEHNPVHTNWYGSSLDELVRIYKLDKVALFDIDIKGALNLKQFEDQFRCNYLFVMPPSMEELDKRLRGRKSESEELIRIRLQNAQEEIDRAKNSGLYDEAKDFIIKHDWQSYNTFLKRVKELYNIPDLP